MSISLFQVRVCQLKYSHRLKKCRDYFSSRGRRDHTHCQSDWSQEENFEE